MSDRAGKNGYIALYRGRKTEVFADTSLQAQTKAAAFFKAKKSYEVDVYLSEKEGSEVTQSTSS
jgi:hypothetical protein